MNIAGIEVGDGQPCRVVAEISNAHNGDESRAHALVDAARVAGADIVKFQIYLPEELVALRGNGRAPDPWGSTGWSMSDLYRKAQTPLGWIPGLVEHCKDIGAPWFSSVFGLGGLAILEAFGCPAYKLAALDYGKRGLREMVAATGKPVVRSCPNDRPPNSDGLALYCPPGYPQAGYHLREAMRKFDGFSYHGTDWMVPLLAAAWGADVVEVHVQLDEEPSELEEDVSLNMTHLARLCDAVRVARGVA